MIRGVTPIVLGAIAAAATACPAEARILRFHANLDGKYGTEPTGSAATGHAAIRVDTAARRVSVDLKVDGITIDNLWDKLVAAPIGPIHFHQYATPTAANSVLALPLPFGPAYRPTKAGLRVRMKDFDYASDAALVKSTLSFDDFLAAIKSGLIVLNVHTDKFNPGEISGLVVAD
jgi:hypothetical protein